MDLVDPSGEGPWDRYFGKQGFMSWMHSNYTSDFNWYKGANGNIDQESLQEMWEIWGEEFQAFMADQSGAALMPDFFGPAMFYFYPTEIGCGPGEECSSPPPQNGPCTGSSVY